MNEPKRVLASIHAHGDYVLVRIYAEHSPDSFELVDWEGARAFEAGATAVALLGTARATLSVVKRPSRVRR